MLPSNPAPQNWSRTHYEETSNIFTNTQTLVNLRKVNYFWPKCKEIVNSAKIVRFQWFPFWLKLDKCIFTHSITLFFWNSNFGNAFMSNVLIRCIFACICLIAHDDVGQTNFKCEYLNSPSKTASKHFKSIHLHMNIDESSHFVFFFMKYILK